MPYLKPDSCRGCPFYSLSKYITPDEMYKDSSILILAQNPGENEEQGKQINRYEFYSGRRFPVEVETKPKPLIGASGHWLKREFWPLTNINYANTSKANVIKCRPNDANDLPSIAGNKPVNNITNKMLKEAVKHCTRTHLCIPKSTKHIMAMGALSLYALTGQTSITEWRGWVIGKDLNDSTVELGVHEYYHPMVGSSFYSHLVNVYPVLHIASLFENPVLYHATLLDFIKFGKLVKGTWPRPLPDIKINTLPPNIPTVLGFDTEYDPEQNNKLIMFSLADMLGNVYVVDHDVDFSRRIHEGTEVITQNGLVDIPHLVQLFDVTKIKLQDCMLAHAALWPGEPHNLDYMTSVYGRYNRHKHLRESHDSQTRYLYAGLDADTTLNHVWKGLQNDFARDIRVWNVYQDLRQPLLHIINRFNSIGIAVDEQRVRAILDILKTRIKEINSEAKAITNNEEFNIASTQQVAKAVYEGVFKIEKEIKVKIKKEKTVLTNKTHSKNLKLNDLISLFEKENSNA